MEAKESTTDSYAWKSILKGREVIQMGARFRVSNGKNIKIWQHHWLPIKHPPLVSSPIIESMENATVDCLIDNSTGKWDDEMIKGVFIPAEAELVRKIPLPRSQIEDVLYWPFTVDGQYNCKSGYKFLKHLEENSEVSTLLEVDKKVWKCIWSLEVPNKYKNMLWRACKNSLPTKQNLVRRTIIQNPSCDHCSLQAEETLHALWSCRAWMRCGKVTDGIFDQRRILLILRSCAAGFLKMRSQWTDLLSRCGVFGINETNSG